MSVISQSLITEYWKSVLSRRMSQELELDRLEMILKGHLYDHNEFDNTHKMTPLEFLDTKRPYGNKNIENSIAFMLGWDHGRVLLEHFMPDNVKSEALALHEALRQRLTEDL